MKELFSHYQEAIRAGFVGTFEDYKKKFPSIVAETKKVEDRPTIYKMTWDEAKASGFVGTMEEWRKQHPNIVLVEKQSEKETPITEEEKVRRLVEIETKFGKSIRERIIRQITDEICISGKSASQELIKELVEKEVLAEKKRISELNWEAYRQLLQD